LEHINVFAGERGVYLKMAHDVFVSYSSQDKQIADAVCAKLESSLIRCWIAPRDVLPGMEYAKALINAIGESHIMILVLSASSNNSPQVLREVERAVSKGIPILPFRIEKITLSESMEYYVSTQHWLDALTPPLEKHLQELTDSVLLLLPDKGKAPVSAGQYINKKYNESDPKGGINKFREKLLKAPVLIGLVLFVLLAGSLVYYFNKPSPSEVSSVSEFDKEAISEYQAVQQSNQIVLQAQTLLKSNGDPNEIMELCDKAIELNPKDDNPYEIKAQIYAQMEMFEQALQELKTAVELNPNVPTNRTFLGNIYYELEDYDLAVEQYKKALEIAAENPDNNNPGWQESTQMARERLKQLGVQDY